MCEYDNVKKKVMAKVKQVSCHEERSSVNWPRVYKYSQHMNMLNSGVFNTAVYLLTNEKEISLQISAH